VRLPSNPSTGYSWRVQSVDASVLKSGGKPAYQAPANQMPGAGGTEVFSFQAARAGEADLILNYARSWETNQPVARTFALKVEVRASCCSFRP